ncbi:Similar to HIP-R: Hsc70-interacting protein 2 (Drosophila melanogaster) [Cotesia congregata]|uniref:Similar to HIP-R: Hsc70-interacting protein 2 (Drosophila melanogaster) n=1 Tax=Cotesia congregata TaxID=51543 RepID=A0A8J2EL36_COTCN|nr:Similar to HIP-R: Hsc70-interacting protein 2 (Drosophila melanogaster) [Cotesia congregata]
MSLPFNKEHLAPLQRFVELCTANPQMLHLPDLAFVKKFIEHFGGKVPMQAAGDPPSMEVPMQPSNDEPEQMESESDAESELELDMTNVVEPDNDPPQKMGNPTVEPTEEEIAEAQSKRSEAVSAFSEKDYEKAIKLYTEAITLNPHAALLYAKRGQVFLEMKKPNACIRDCDRALELNPDSAAAHKFRGRANQLLGNFEEAATDLRLACKFDFDEQADEWLREVTPNVSTAVSSFIFLFGFVNLRVQKSSPNFSCE